MQKELTGRLGNQMFQYAAMRGILAKNDRQEPIQVSFKKYVYSNGFRNDLQDFQVVSYEEVNNLKLSVWQKILIFWMKVTEKILSKTVKKEKFEQLRFTYEKKMAPILTTFGIYFMRQGYYPFKKSLAKNKVMIGYFESSQYFDHIRPQILEEFTPKYEKKKENIDLYNKIENTESVCVTIRRGDYLTEQNKGNHYICTPEYFETAIKKIQDKVKNPKFFVFSDDVEWVKNNMNFPEGTEYERGNDPIWEKLRLMYSCKHFILSNSTFSWWAQYLSRNEKKVVVAPSKWRRIGYSDAIYQENWNLISV